MLLPTERPKFHIEGADWPNRGRSDFVRADGLRWHIQRWPRPTPDAPEVLLIHGTGAATHSWAELAPLLAARAGVLAVDLPGHGFTDMPSWPSRLSLPGMSAALAALLEALDLRPKLIVGHSAGAAIALRMTLDGRIAPARIIALNGALRPFQGIAGVLFPQLARLLFVNPFAPRLFAFTALDRARVERLLEGTGSRLPPDGLARYVRLFQSPGHVAGALGMMAHWDLAPLERDLARLRIPLTLAAADGDRTVSPEDAAQIAARAPDAERLSVPGLGHLAHEEAPDIIAPLIFERM